METGGAEVPRKQPKRGRLWLNDGSCVELRPQKRDHAWSYDMAAARTTGGRPLRFLVILDEYVRECLPMAVARRRRSQEVLGRLYEIFITRGAPGHMQSDNVLSLESNSFSG
jgi:hypothetical protein